MEKKLLWQKKMENGVALYYGPVASRAFESFNYSELIDLRINALDLLENPQGYLFDKETRKVIMSK